MPTLPASAGTASRVTRADQSVLAPQSGVGLRAAVGGTGLEPVTPSLSKWVGGRAAAYCKRPLRAETAANQSILRLPCGPLRTAPDRRRP
jgi:hypothetical protein